MATDPFPNTSDPTTEQRLGVLFNSTNTILVTPTDPIDRKEGYMWLNTTTQELNIFSGGIVWTVGKVSAKG